MQMTEIYSWVNKILKLSKEHKIAHILNMRGRDYKDIGNRDHWDL